MDERSQLNLAGVHPDLVKVVEYAYANTEMPFVVIDGLRSRAEELANVAKGASTTVHSRHLPNTHGFACAVDVVAYPGGHVSWHAKDYLPIDKAFQAASKALGIPVEWGGDWNTFKDLGHFQLPWSKYP